ncbi:MCE family protein [Sciscionella sediminilitoris]|uniref:MCE family protein n=1 Tax=Sciscionella sediminilitoris TaxID=1445613 RepID=UPI0004DFB707|nr:MCE family protein [Sciscionella sp. SE31]
MDVSKRQVSRRVRALRGLAVGVVLLVGGVFAVLASMGGLTTLPVISSVVEVSGSPLAVNAPVQYRGVVVGKLKTVVPLATGRTTSRIEMRIQPEQLHRIPSSVQVRILPRTVFGDQFLDLIDAGPRAASTLTAGARIAADRSKQTVDLYDSYEKAYNLITGLRPAQINQVLTALSTLLDGKGNEIGSLIDRAYNASGKLMPLTGKIKPTVEAFANMSGKLRQAAPDAYGVLRNAVDLSQFVAHRQGDIAALLAGGGAAADQGTGLLAQNKDNIIRLLHTGNPVGSTFATYPEGLPDMFKALANLGNSTDGVSNKTTIHANRVDLYNSKPYTSKDCPRYPGLDGPNCSVPAPPDLPLQGEQSRPPGDDQLGGGQQRTETPQTETPQDEAAKLRSLLPRITGSAQQPPKSMDGILQTYLGTALRGSTVVTQ